MKFALIAIGYNRKEGFARLIASLLNADYKGDNVDLIMSIDNSGTSVVEEYAHAVYWPYGQKKIRTFPTRQGLRKHILACGDYLEEYEAVAVFEDDVVAAPSFYNFAKQCVKKYYHCPDVVGISLYTHLFNVFAQYPFIPAPGKHDVFFLQMAQSWGQVWMKNQWKMFVEWYQENETSFSLENLPASMGKWGKNSWLKYHIKFCVDNNKYFVYPYQSVTTCFSEVGEHNLSSSNAFQVPLCQDADIEYVLPDVSEKTAVYYDIFFERQKLLAKELGIPDHELTVDLYGLKPIDSCVGKYLLSSQVYPYRVIKTYARSMRPHELNVLYALDGNDFYLYDTTLQVPQAKQKKNSEEEKFSYYHGISSRTKNMLKLSMMRIREILRLHLKRKKK